MSIKHQAVRSLKWNSLSAVWAVAIQVLRTIILARMLDPRDYGLMGMLMVVMGFAEAFCDAGISSSVIHRQVSHRNELSSLFWFNMVTGVVVYLLLVASIPFLVWYYREPVLASMAVILFSSVLLRGLSRIPEAILSKELRFQQIARVEMFSGGISLVVAILCAWNGLGAWSLVWSHVSKIGVQGVVQFLLNWNTYRPALHFSWNEVKEHMRFGLFQLGEMNVRYLAQRFDQLLLARILGAGSLGFYNYANQLVLLPVNRVNPIVTRVAFPVFARFQDDKERLRRLYLKVIQMLSTINAPLLMLIALMAPRYVPVLLGAKWNPSIPLIQLFSLVAFSRSIGSPIGALFLSKGRTDFGFYQNIALMIGNIPAVYIGTLYYGAAGAIVGLLLIQVVLGFPIYYFFMKPLIGKCGWNYVRAWLAPLFSSLIAGACMYWIDHLFLINVNDWLALVTVTIGSVALYGLILWKIQPDIAGQFRQLRSKDSWVSV